jgi:hypothetical protein
MQQIASTLDGLRCSNELKQTENFSTNPLSSFIILSFSSKNQTERTANLETKIKNKKTAHIENKVNH